MMYALPDGPFFAAAVPYGPALLTEICAPQRTADEHAEAQTSGLWDCHTYTQAMCRSKQNRGHVNPNLALPAGLQYGQWRQQGEREEQHLDDLAKLPKVLRALEQVLIAQLQCKAHNVDQVALHYPHILRKQQAQPSLHASSYLSSCSHTTHGTGLWSLGE